MKQCYKRVLSLLLALVMTFGLVPETLMTTASAASSGPPETISLSSLRYNKLKSPFPGMRSHMYKYANTFPGSDKPGYLHEFETSIEGTRTPTFCYNHEAWLDTPCANAHDRFKLSGESFTSDSNKIGVFLDYFYTRAFKSQELRNQYPNGVPDGVASGEPLYMDTASQQVTNAWVQVFVWWSKADPSAFANILDDSAAGDAQLRIIAKEYANIWGHKRGNFNTDPVFGVSTFEEECVLRLKDMIRSWKSGECEHYTYYVYTIDKKNCGYSQAHQSLLVPVPEPGITITDTHMWVKIQKVDDAGKPLAGAEFSVYADSTCQDVIGTMTTDDTGWAYLQLPDPFIAGKSQVTVWARETKAPGNYKLATSTWMAQPRAEENKTKDTAAAFNGGAPIVNKIDDDGGGDDDDTITKVDAKTNQPVGPATFHIEGTTLESVEGHDPISMDVRTDVNGHLKLNWWNPKDPNYIPPGNYFVSELVPPPGYTKSDEVKRLDLWMAEDGMTPMQSGPIVFANWPTIVIQMMKYSEDGKPLKGAVFDIFKNGQKVGSGVTDDFGSFVFDGPEHKGVDDGMYKFVEVEPPDGYLLPYNNVAEVYVDTDNLALGNPIVLSMVNHKMPEIVIKKFQAGTEKPLAGAIFEVMIDNEILGTFGPTAADGTIVINSERYGEFLRNHHLEAKESWTVSVRETVAPEGHLMDSNDWITFEMHQGEKLKEFVFHDTAYPEIEILKLDRETGAPLANCSFNVAINGIDIGKHVTGEDGKVKITWEEYGRFLGDINGDELAKGGWAVTVTELEMPDKYNKDRQEGSTGGDGYTITQHLQPQQALMKFVFKDTSYRDVKVTKLDAETGWPLAGATFNLHCVAADSPLSPGNISDRQLTTDSTGWVTFVDVPNGTYELSEIKAPNGYEENPEWSTGDKGNKTTIIVTSDSDPIIEVTAENEPKSGFRLLKVDADTRQPIPGVVFEFTPVAPLTGSPFEATTDENGVITVENLNIGQGGNGVKEGTYIAVEKSAPKPYRVDPTPHTVEVRNGHDATQITLNNYADGMLNILKIDSVTGEPLAGAYFKIESAGGTHIADVGPTGRNGYVSFGPLEPGASYRVTEIRGPELHILDPMPQTFEVPEDISGFVKTLIFENTPQSNLWLRKIDAETGLGLKGAIFKITTGDGTIIRQNAETDEGGYIRLNGLEPGTYIAEETKAPVGYILDPTPHVIVLRTGHTEIFRVENRQPGGIRIRKVDSATGDPLEGAEFQLYDINDTPIGGVVKTGIDGYATWNNLEGGQYQVEEVKAPKGYIRDTHKRKIEVKDFVTTQYEWKNSQEATITVYKRDGDTLVPLGGAKFEIRNMDGGVVQTLTTDLTGSATSSRLPLGWYRVVEVEAPRGYTLNPDEHLVEVKDGTPVSIDHLDWSDKVLIVHKRDAVTKQPLTGAWFELQTIDGKLVQEQFGTDASGVCVTKALEPGKYYPKGAARFAAALSTSSSFLETVLKPVQIRSA